MEPLARIEECGLFVLMDDLLRYMEEVFRDYSPFNCCGMTLTRSDRHTDNLPGPQNKATLLLSND